MIKLADLEFGAAGAIARASVDWTGVPLLATMPLTAAGVRFAMRPVQVDPYPLSIRRLINGFFEDSPTIETTHPAPHVQTMPGNLVLVVGTTSRRRPGG